MSSNISQGQQTHHTTSLLPVAVSSSELNAVSAEHVPPACSEGELCLNHIETMQLAHKFEQHHCAVEIYCRGRIKMIQKSTDPCKMFIFIELHFTLQ